MWTDPPVMSQSRRIRSSLPVAAVICVVGTFSARADADPPPEQLVFRASHAIFAHAEGLREPSGLALDPSTGTFLTVSDDSRHVFRLDAGGRITKRLHSVDDLEDAEGIDVASDGRILILSEELGGIVSMDPSDPNKAVLHLLSELPGFDAFLAVADNDAERLSPEGLAVNGKSGAVLVANERDPRVLIEVSPALDRIVGATVLSEERGFVCRHATDAELDISGLAYDAGRDGLWITSDTGKCVFFWDGSESPARHFDLAWLDGDTVRTVDNAEGVALAPDGVSLFLVTDNGKESRLFEYAVE
jgi:uncharacterized protein YjiK